MHHSPSVTAYHPKKSSKVKDFGADLLVMGAHGHKGYMDWVLGSSINEVRHALDIPVLVVK